MIKENQFIKIYICRKNMMDYYISKGYKCDIGEYIMVEAKDLTDGSKKPIEYICDYCGKTFIRTKGSNSRSKKSGNTKDSCVECSRRSRSKETSIIKYGVDNPMKVSEITLKCQNSKRNNFDGTKPYSCTTFEKGIPVSKGQLNLANILKEYELNFKYETYYIDLVKDNIAIEYDGRGHDMGVRIGNINLEDFLKKEKQKEELILQSFRLLRIIDKKDKLKKEVPKEIIQQIMAFIKGEEKYSVITIS